MRLTWINGAFPRGRRIPGDLPGPGLAATTIGATGTSGSGMLGARR